MKKGMRRRFLMLHKIVFFMVFLALPTLAADILVLKNGKRLNIDDAYEIKGQFVVFKQNGQLSQLPLKIVDLDKSKHATAELRAEEEARRKAAQVKVVEKEAPKYSDMSQIAEFVESSRSKNNPRKDNVNISSDGLGSYTEKNPAPKNTAAEFNPQFDEENSLEARKALRVQLGDSYLQTQQEIKELDDKIVEAEQYAQLLANENAFGDEPTGLFYKKLESADKLVLELKQARETKVQEMKDLEKKARDNGIRDLKRYKPAKEDERK